MNITTG